MIGTSFTGTFRLLPNSIQNLVHRIAVQLDPDEIVLFGSRARGDHRETSDFDIAVRFRSAPTSVWARLLVDLQEEPITLYRVDLVDFSSLSDEFKKRILLEGKKIYVRESV